MKKNAFTLIELLVVISIIGILAGFLFVSYSGIQKQTRDTERKKHINQYQTSLEVFANVNNDYYPSYTTASGEEASGAPCAALSRVISGCPEDPRNADDQSFVYKYQSDGNGSGGVSATQYVLWTKLEATNDYWVLCSKGKSGTKAQAGFSVSGGTCPI